MQNEECRMKNSRSADRHTGKDAAAGRRICKSGVKRPEPRAGRPEALLPVEALGGKFATQAAEVPELHDVPSVIAATRVPSGESVR
jgi:hypothetical protein